MPNLKKLIAKLRENPSEVRFQTIKRILEHFGYRVSNVKGSHFHFSQDEKPSIRIVVHHLKVTKWYIKDAIKILEENFQFPSQKS